MTDENATRASCLCGAVTLEVAETRDHFGACHCGVCRKWGGGPLLAMDCGTAIKFGGEDSIRVYDSSPWAERGFCATCGTHLFYRIKASGKCHVPLGLFGEAINPRFAVQVFIDRKPESYSFANETKLLTEKQIFEMYAPVE